VNIRAFQNKSILGAHNGEKNAAHSIFKKSKGDTVMPSPIINFCKQEAMSICTASDKKHQAGCRFYEKSRFAERCMYYIFDEYCDCLKAQMNKQSEGR